MLLCNTGPLLSRRLTELQSDCEIWQAMCPSWVPLLLLECGICARRLAESSSRWQPHQIRLAEVGARVRTCTRDPQAISHPIWCQWDASHDPILWKMTGRAACECARPTRDTNKVQLCLCLPRLHCVRPVRICFPIYHGVTRARHWRQTARGTCKSIKQAPHIHYSPVTVTCAHTQQ